MAVCERGREARFFDNRTSLWLSGGSEDSTVSTRGFGGKLAGATPVRDDRHARWGCELIVRQREVVPEALKAVQDERIDLPVDGCHRGQTGVPAKSIWFRLLRTPPCAVLTVPL